MSESCCCSKSQGAGAVPDAPVTRNGFIQTTAELSWRDRLGAVKVRWGLNRMHYTVAPGLYRVGEADAHSPVLVTANYKLSFDLLRSRLSNISAWILVLDTKGINVWCAAGKGTFSTAELIRQITNANLHLVISHREIIVPQLGAPGVAAHEVRKQTGFRVLFGPVDAANIPAFLANGKKATPEMRRVQFKLMHRITLIPMELIPALKWAPALLVLILVMRFAEGSGLRPGIAADLVSYLGAIGIGSILFQISLPWIPGRSFAWKGWLLGFLWALSISVWLHTSVWTTVSNALVLPVIAAYLAFNFTGSTTFTSLSGVQKELRIAAPAMITSAASGIILRLAQRLWN